MLTNKQKYEKYKPKKFLGQNFLVDENIAKKIVSSLEISEDDTVVEIGPGQGVLTKYICQLTSNATAVEIDSSIFNKLTETFKDKIILIHGDFLKFDILKEVKAIKAGKKIKIIGNIPYNITSEILFKLFEIADKIDLAVLMMQKEVAKRLNAKPDTKDYGILAIQSQIHARPKILFNVSAASFFPKPNVDSSVVRLVFNESKSDIKDKELFKKLVKESFGQRRKTLRNSLKKFFESKNILFENIDFDFGRRAGNVRIDEFIEIGNRIYELQNESKI